MLATVNFDFLRKHDDRLATFGAQAERYFRDDPSTAIIKVRQFVELLAKLIAAHHALYLGERETFEDTLRRRIEVAIGWIDRLASEATGARKLVDHLDQAVLAKAFRGELVPQDPDDEPASVLLERIKAERATSQRNGGARGRPRRTA